MSRVQLEKIQALTFYKDAVTTARRGSPIPQLVCLGKPCSLYTPEAVRCTNLGGQGTEIDWKCEADLPATLRFGRVEVSCEGWSHPGDPYVLKGSCGLEYRLVQLSSNVQNDDYRLPRSQWFQPDTILSSIFSLLWISVLAFLLYKILRSCLRPRNSGTTPTHNNRGSTPGYGGPGGWFPGTDEPNAPPPPYTKHTSNDAWQPGFWTGTALGAAGTYLMNRNNERRRSPPPQRARWDWERSATTSRPSPRFDNSDRGEGSSNLGAMRSSTGFGGSRVR